MRHTHTGLAYIRPLAPPTPRLRMSMRLRHSPPPATPPPRLSGLLVRVAGGPWRLCRRSSFGSRSSMKRDQGQGDGRGGGGPEWKWPMDARKCTCCLAKQITGHVRCAMRTKARAVQLQAEEPVAVLFVDLAPKRLVVRGGLAVALHFLHFLHPARRLRPTFDVARALLHLGLRTETAKRILQIAKQISKRKGQSGGVGEGGRQEASGWIRGRT